MIYIDHSERDRERRFKILEGCKWDLTEARRLLQWVDVGDYLTPEVGHGIERAGLCGSEHGR